MSVVFNDHLKITAPKFEAVHNNNNQFFRLLKDNFNSPEIVNAEIAKVYKEHGSITYIIDDALIHYMKESFKRLCKGRRKMFPNYKIIGLSESGFSPYPVPKSKVADLGRYVELIRAKPAICGSTQMKRPMTLGCLTKLKKRVGSNDLLFFIAYTDDTLAAIAEQLDLPMMLMAADIPGPMTKYFGPWDKWYYLRYSLQDRVNLAGVCSNTTQLMLPNAYPAGVGDHSFFKQSNEVEEYIATHTSISAGQVTMCRVLPDFNSNVEILNVLNEWQASDIDVCWGGMGRGREDSFGLATSKSYLGEYIILRVATDYKGVYYCGIFMFQGKRGDMFIYTPLPVKNKITLKQINEQNNRNYV